MHQAANRLVEKGKLIDDDKVVAAVEQDEPGPSSFVSVNIIEILPR